LDNIFVERLWRDVKHEDIYLKGYATLPEVQSGLTEYMVFRNSQRMHQSLDYSTPDEVYRTASGGGARIVDKFKEKIIAPQINRPTCWATKYRSKATQYGWGTTIKDNAKQGKVRYK
jgi:hypothetical protein